MQTVKLNNGVEMPVLGFGVYRVQDAALCEQIVLDALNAGYRLIDTAELYHNEAAVGKAIERSGVPRKDLFVTSKVWISNAGHEQTQQAFADSLNRLGLEYLDLYLIHAPYNDVYGAWRAMEELYDAGKIRALGISNFPMDRMIDLGLYNKVKPAVNQIEIHPLFQQTQWIDYMKANDVVAEAYSPLAANRSGLFANEVLNALAARYGKSVAQIILRWHIQRGIVAIPKSAHQERIAENIHIFDFELSPDDMARIAALDTHTSVYFSYADPETVKRFKSFAA
jgi:2,5-diketo-D-gluconate reductase A